jgi:predicted ATP-dependent serine protease
VVSSLSLGANKTLIQQLREIIALNFPQTLTVWEEYIPLSTGIEFIDKRLLPGGLPCGQLIEIIGSKSSGKTTFLLKILSGLSSHEKVIAYFDLSQTFYPPSAEKSGIDLKKLLILRPENIQAGLRAAEILFRNKAINITVFDLVETKEQLQKTLLLRLKKSLIQVRGIGIFLREPDSTQIQGNKISLSLKVERLNQKVSIKIEKSLFGMINKSVEMVQNE